MFTFLEISQVSSVWEPRLISAVSQSESFLLLLLLFFCNILSVGTLFQFFNNVSGMTSKINNRVFFYPIRRPEVVKEY